MTSRKCTITECVSVQGSDKDEGVTFHRFPQTNANWSEKWVKGERQL